MKQRIHSIDIVRGLVMIIMALDHTRDLLHFSALSQSPTDLSVTTPALFISRWITHLCAPTFVLLSGISVYISLQRAGNTKSLGSFLRKRGLWLILLEITLVNFAIWFDVQFRIVMLQVIAAIGFGFIILSFLLKTSPKKIGITALVIIALHNLLQFVPPLTNPILKAFSNLFFAPGIIPVSPNFSILISYPFIQWAAIMLLGFSIGKIFMEARTVPHTKLITYAIISLTLFFLFRFVNIYGDPAPWQHQKDGLFTFFHKCNQVSAFTAIHFSVYWYCIFLIEICRTTAFFYKKYINRLRQGSYVLLPAAFLYYQAGNFYYGIRTRIFL